MHPFLDTTVAFTMKALFWRWRVWTANEQDGREEYLSICSFDTIEIKGKAEPRETVHWQVEQRSRFTWSKVRTRLCPY